MQWLKQVGQHPGITKPIQFENHKKGWVNITGMVGQHETERWVNMLRNLHAIAKKKLKLTHSPYEILQYISLAPFEKRSITEVFLNNENQDVKELKCIQLKII